MRRGILLTIALVSACASPINSGWETPTMTAGDVVYLEIESDYIRDGERDERRSFRIAQAYGDEGCRGERTCLLIAHPPESIYWFDRTGEAPDELIISAHGTGFDCQDNATFQYEITSDGATHVRASCTWNVEGLDGPTTGSHDVSMSVYFADAELRAEFAAVAETIAADL